MIIVPKKSPSNSITQKSHDLMNDKHYCVIGLLSLFHILQGLSDQVWIQYVDVSTCLHNCTYIPTQACTNTVHTHTCTHTHEHTYSYTFFFCQAIHDERRLNLISLKVLKSLLFLPTLRRFYSVFWMKFIHLFSKYPF